jgi:hypothetical protein
MRRPFVEESTPTAQAASFIHRLSFSRNFRKSVKICRLSADEIARTGDRSPILNGLVAVYPIR